LFSQLPAGHVALVVVDRTTNEHVAEVFLKLAEVPGRVSSPARPERMYAQRTRIQTTTLATDDQIARAGADRANGEVGEHDPSAYALFPVGEDLSRFKVDSLRPALAVGRPFLDVIARGSAIPEIKSEAEQLAQSIEPIAYESARLASVGVESDVVALLRSTSGAFAVRAKLKLTDPRPASALPAGDGLDVLVSARVFDTLAQHGLPAVPFAEGPELRRTCHPDEWTLVDLELPVVPRRTEGYFVQAKVRSRDPRFRRTFDPSNCFARQLDYGA
jgi:hypothetical protein